MKITNICTLTCHCYRTNWVFVKVETDEGVAGVGEATLEHREIAVTSAIEHLRHELIGFDPFNIEQIWFESYRGAYWRGGPVLLSAISGIDQALWDIKGKALGLPVWQLLGGSMRKTVPAYANGWFSPAKTPQEFANKAKETVARGWKALKWDPFGSAYMTLGRVDFHRAMDTIAAVRQAVGPSVELMIEGHGRFNVPTAIQIGQALAPYDVSWFEEPIPPDNFEALASVRQRIPVAVAAGERVFGRWDWRRFLEAGAADYIQPDVCHAGGISEMRKIAAMAEAYHLPFCPHNPMGPIGTAATLHLAACIPNFQWLEIMATDVPQRRDICDEQVQFSEGNIHIPNRPGLGVELNEDAIVEYPYKPIQLRHYRGDLTDIRPADAESYFA